MTPIARTFAVGVIVLGAMAAQSQTQAAPAKATTASVGRIPAKEAHDLVVAGRLLKAGALTLSLEYLKMHPPTVASADVWQAWAEQKWSIMILLKDWQALKQDAKGLPASFGGAKYFSIAYQTQAMIALGEYAQARRLLQPALQANNIPLRLQKGIREQLIALYQAQGDYANAKIEAVRFHDDFKPQDSHWFIQRAVIEYLSGDAAGASRLLAANAAIEAKLLQILFRYKAGELDNTKAQLHIEQQLQRKRISPGERKLAFGILAEVSVASDEDSRIARIRALEQYIVVDSEDIQADVIVFDAQNLKSAYLALSDLLINRALKDPSRISLKFSLAQQRQTAGETTRARALYTDVLLNKDETMLGAAAKNSLVNSLIQADQFLLLTQLLGADKPLGDFADIDSNTSAQILDHALTLGDVNVISSIAPYLGAAPENVPPRDWTLQKARIDIFAGRFEQGRDKIVGWLEQGDILNGEEVDRVLQAVFDLQAVQQNDIGLELFDLIQQQTNSRRHKREIDFWKAQSYDAKGQRVIAAQYYLQSALVEANGFDQWGHSARYHAASTLMEAGQHADARRLFEGLLAATTDTARRGTIKQALQRLWLLENQKNQ